MSGKKRIIVIGGSAAGPKAAAKARRLDEEAEIVIIQKAPDLSMASCGYPYYVGGFFDDRNLLICTPTGVVRDPKFYLNAKGIVARTETEATAIDPKSKVVSVRDLKTGKDDTLPYDKLILATGAIPRIPPIPGASLTGITTLQSMQDADYLRKIRDEKTIKKAVIIGGGLIGIETCEALQLAGIEITVIEMLPQLLTFLDWELAKLVENHVRSKNANVITDNGIAEFLGENGRLTGVKLQNGIELPCELAVVAIGVNPNSKLARDAGLEIGSTGGIVVNEYMQTSDPDIYAAGDCVESLNLITGKKVHAPYGDLANLQGRVAGENAAAGNSATFPGTIQTGICKVFDFAAGSTGLSEKSGTCRRLHGHRDRYQREPGQARFYDRPPSGHKAGGGARDRKNSRRPVRGARRRQQAACHLGNGDKGRPLGGRHGERGSALRAAVFPGNRSFDRHGPYNAEQAEGKNERSFMLRREEKAGRRRTTLHPGRPRSR